MSKLHNHNDKKSCCCCHEHKNGESHHKEHKSTHEHEHHDEHDHGCGCGHDHEHGGNIEGKEIGKIFLAAAFLVFAIFVGKYATDLSNKYGISLGTVETVSLVLYLVAYFTVGGEVVRTAVKNISKGKIFDENFLMAVATVGAFFIGEYPEAVAVMMFYQGAQI